MIVDDEINRLLANPLPPGVRMHIVVGEPAPISLTVAQLSAPRPTMSRQGSIAPADACHSASACDLEFRAKFKPGRGCYWKQEYARRPSVYKV